MAAGELADQKLALVAWKLAAQIGLQPDQVKLFSGEWARDGRSKSLIERPP